MKRLSLENRIVLLLAVGLLAHSVTGCGGTNLSGYRPASEHDAADQVEPNVGRTGLGEPKTGSAAPDPDQPLGLVPDETQLLPASALVPVNVVSSVRGLMSIPTSDPSPGDTTTTLLPSETAAKDLAAKVKPNEIELLVKDKKFQTEPKTGALRISFDDLDLLKVLNMDPVVPNADALMPDWLKGLDGKSVRIRGFMYPTYETEGIERFVLARDNQICCFGRDPKIYDLIQIDMKPGKTTNYIPATRAFDVVGTFRIQMLAEDGKPYGLYLIDQATVIDR